MNRAAASFLVGLLGLSAACDDAENTGEEPRQSRWSGSGTFEPSSAWTSGQGALQACTDAPLDARHTCDGGRGLTCARMLWWYDEPVHREYRCWIDYGETVRHRPRFDSVRWELADREVPGPLEWQLHHDIDPIGLSRARVVLSAHGRAPVPAFRFSWRTLDRVSPR